MPLESGTSSAVFSRNVSEMMHAGHPQKQALAAAYAKKRESYRARKAKRRAKKAPSP